METRPLTRDVETDGDEEMPEEHSLGVETPRRRKQNHIRYSLSVLTLVILPNIVSALAGAFIFHAWWQTEHLGPRCAAYTSQYSPVVEEARVTYSPTNFNGSFMQEDVFRRRGSPEVDAAWESLGVNYRAGVISHKEGLRSGLTTAHVQRADKYGGGFFVNVEGLHHLHCLDLVRKALYYNYPYYKAMGKHAFLNDDKILELHVSHCLDTVRQVLMCNADTGVLGQVWYNKEEPEAFPDFKTTHQCKNFDAIRKWAEEHQEPEVESLPPDYMRIPNPEDILAETP